MILFQPVILFYLDIKTGQIMPKYKKIDFKRTRINRQPANPRKRKREPEPVPEPSQPVSQPFSETVSETQTVFEPVSEPVYQCASTSQASAKMKYEILMFPLLWFESIVYCNTFTWQ